MPYHPGPHDWYFVGMEWMTWSDKFKDIHTIVPNTAAITAEETVRAWWKGIYSVNSPRTQDQYRLTSESFSYSAPGNSINTPATFLKDFIRGNIGIVQLYGAATRDLEFDPLRKFDYTIWPMPKLTPSDSKYVSDSVVSPWATGNAGYSTIWNEHGHEEK
jgi:hypothetical protein